jgi:nucleoid DNA-binding protein
MSGLWTRSGTTTRRCGLLLSCPSLRNNPAMKGPQFGCETVASRVRLELNLSSDREADNVVRTVLDGIVAEIKEHIEIDGFTLKLPSFGKFTVRHKQGKMRKIPLTGKTQMTADNRKVKFTPLSYAPGRLQLPSLGVAASFSHGMLAVGQRTNPAVGEVDLLIRSGGASELKIMPVTITGQCSDVPNGAMQMKIQTDSSIPAQLKTPSFLSSSWEPRAVELKPHDATGQILITVCRQLSQSKTLNVNLSYGSEEIPQSDAPLVAEALDEIAAAVMAKR